MSTLVKAPIVYEPTFKDGTYIDYLEKYKWTEFSECGIRCNCIKSNTIHRNKNSFKFQHCKTKNHRKYLETLNKEPPVNNEGLLGDELVLALKEMKHMKIQLGKQHEAFQLEKQKNQSMQSQLKDILLEKEEALAEAAQANEFVQQSSKKICKLEKEKKGLEDKIKKFDKITQEMMKLSGYELE
tara:strand:+ start:4501 stop:5052 length:552 start_codon:yes stop_codon:yes gene_type:complete